MTFNTEKKKKLIIIFWGQVNKSFRGQVFFIRFVLYLPEWASDDKNLCSTLANFEIEPLQKKVVVQVPIQMLPPL